MEKTSCAENCAKMIGGTLKGKSIEKNQLDKIANFHMKKIVENRKWYFSIHMQQPNWLGKEIYWRNKT